LLAVGDERRNAGTPVWILSPGWKENKLHKVGVEGMVLLEEPAMDGEGIARTSSGKWIVAHEGNPRADLLPGLGIFCPETGKKTGDLKLPAAFFPATSEGGAKGLQSNRGMESAAVSPCGEYFFTCSEAPLLQDLETGTPVWEGPIRLLRYSLTKENQAPEQRIYRHDHDAAYNSVVDLAAWNGSKIWVLERSMMHGEQPRKVRVRIYEVEFEAPTGSENLAKHLIFDSEKEGLEVDNVEGICIIPAGTGRPEGILLVSDDNFRGNQKTEFYFLRKKYSGKHEASAER
jgi:hypothetical protein